MDPFLSESDPSASGLRDGGGDVELLKKAWKNEKAAPDILPYEEDLVKRIQQLLEDAVGLVFLDTMNASLSSMCEVNGTIVMLHVNNAGGQGC